LAPTKTDVRAANYEICEVRSQLAGKDVELNKMEKQLEQQTNDYMKQSWEERKKFETKIKAVTAQRDRLEKTFERQHLKLKKTLLDKQVVEMKLRESRTEIRRLKALLKDNDGEEEPSKKIDRIDPFYDGPNTSTRWSTDSD
jgi:chromosome segregation ATPase